MNDNIRKFTVMTIPPQGESVAETERRIKEALVAARMENFGVCYICDEMTGHRNASIRMAEAELKRYRETQGGRIES